MRLLDKHIFSFRQDVLAFTSFIPVYLLHLLVFDALKVPLPEIPPLSFFVLGWLLVDGSHVYSTLLVSYTDKEMFRQLRPLMIGLPIALLLVIFSLYHYKGPVYLVVALLAVIHFVRQEFGWMKIASRLDSAAPNWLRHLDLYASYAMTILPMIWFLRESAPGHWYTEGDLFVVPDKIGNLALMLFWPVLAVFIFTNAWHSWKTRTINASKFLVAINTFFGWYMAKVHVASPYLAIWLLIFHHGLPYYFIVFKTERVSRQISWISKLNQYRIPFLYFGCVGVFGLFLFSHLGTDFANNLKADPLYRAIIYTIAVTPQLTHFILDGFIWKKKYGLVKS